MHHATWRFYGIPFPEAQWFGLGNPKHQLAETHVLAPLKTKECLLKSDYNYFHRTYIFFVPFIFREDILVFPFFFVSERFSSDRCCTIHSEGGSKSLFHFDLDRHQSSATVPPVIILGKVQIMHQHQKLQAIFWFVFFSPYKNPHPFFVDLLIYSLSSSKLCQVETASSRRSCKAWANLGSMESTCKVSSVASWHELFKGQRFGMEKEGVLRIEHNDHHHHHHHHRHHSHHRHHF